MSDFDTVKFVIDLADYVSQYAHLQRAGSLMQCCCPLPGHIDKTPSFQVKGDHWTCRGKCGVGGDVFDFAMAYHGWSKQEALIELARYAGVTLEPLSFEHRAKQDKREHLYALMEHAAQFYSARLYDNDAALDYLCGQRGLTLETIEAARIGYAPYEWTRLCVHLRSCGYSDYDMLAAGMVKQGKDDKPYDTFRNRIMIPVRDTKGRIVAFTGRAMEKDQTPKYLHNATNEIFNKSTVIHRAPSNQSTKAIETFSSLVVVEGSLDPVSALNRGIYNVVSQMGTSLTDEQLALLCQPGIERLVFCLDKDDAGRTALRRLVEKHAANAANKGVSLYAMFAPHGKDPDDTFREKPELWQPAVDAGRPVVDVLIDQELSSLGDRPSPAQLSNMARALLPVLKSDNPFVQIANIETLASRTGIAPSALQHWLTPQIHLLPKNPHVTKIETLPCLEEWIIHSLIVNDDAYWFERANAALDTVTTDTLAYALAPLSINDFTRKETHMIMGQITRMVLDNDRPLYAALDAYFEGGNNAEIYQRLRETEARSLILGGPGAMDYEEFISAVFGVRVERLLRDAKDTRLDAATRRECSIGIALLRLTQEELI
jgi:DNA primase catalytic core